MMKTVKALVNCESRIMIWPKLSDDIIMYLLLTNVNGKLVPFCPDTPLCDAAKRIYFLFILTRLFLVCCHFKPDLLSNSNRVC